MPRWKCLSASLLIAYLFLVIAGTVLDRKTGTSAKAHNDLLWTYRAILEGGRKKAWMRIEILMNCAMLMPIGIFFPLAVTNRKNVFLKTLLFGLFFSIGIELTQYYSRRGIFEWGDIMHNTLGVILGYGMFSAVRALIRRHKQC